MRKYRRNPSIENRRHQEQQALALVAELGFEEAIVFCVEQEWQGTLSAIVAISANRTRLQSG